MAFKIVGADEAGDFPPRVEDRLTEKFQGKVWSGEGVPNNADGRLGDFYIDTLNGRMYGPREQSAWPSTYKSIIGPAGTPGLKGDKGDKGDTGDQGIQGLKGDKGDTGVGAVAVTGSATALNGATVNLSVASQGRIITINGTVIVTFAAATDIEVAEIAGVSLPGGARVGVANFGGGSEAFKCHLGTNGRITLRRATAGSVTAFISITYFV